VLLISEKEALHLFLTGGDCHASLAMTFHLFLLKGGLDESSPCVKRRIINGREISLLNARPDPTCTRLDPTYHF